MLSMHGLVVTVLAAAAAVAWQLLPGKDADVTVLRNRKVLLTGASYGIGRAMALQYCRAGASVYVTARSRTRLEDLVTECRRLTPDGHHGYTAADLSDMGEVQRATQAAVMHFNDVIDVLVLNHVGTVYSAAYRKKMFFSRNPNPADHITAYDVMHDVNVRSYIHMTAHANQALHNSQAGSVLVIGSIAGHMTSAIVREYTADKHALKGYFLSLGDELRATGSSVSVTYAYVGSVATEGTKKLEPFFAPDGDAPPRGSADLCAQVLVRGAALRMRTVTYVEMLPEKIIWYLYDVLPQSIIDKLVKPVVHTMLRHL